MNGDVKVVMFIDGTLRTEIVDWYDLISHQRYGQLVKIDLRGGRWYYDNRKYVEEYRFGETVRVPEGGEFHGPMMVFIEGDEAHEAAVEYNRSLHELGELTP